MIQLQKIDKWHNSGNNPVFLLTADIRAIKAAIANPVKSLRTE